MGVQLGRICGGFRIKLGQLGNQRLSIVGREDRFGVVCAQVSGNGTDIGRFIETVLLKANREGR